MDTRTHGLPPRRERSALASLLVLTLLSCRSTPKAPVAEADGATPLDVADHVRLPMAVEPKGYALELTVDPRQPGFSGRVLIEATAHEPTRRVVLNAKGLDFRRATLRASDGRALEPAFRMLHDDGVAELALPSSEAPIPPGGLTVEIEYTGTLDQAFEGLFVVEEQGERYVYSQFEATAARNAFPCFDEPRFKTPFDIALTVPTELSAISNMPSVEERPAGPGSKRVRFERTPPLPTYLVAVGAGPFDVVDGGLVPSAALRGRPVRVRAIAPKGQGPRTGFALKEGAAIVSALERRLGSPFPYPKLDLVAVPGFPGAMENVGFVTVAARRLLVDPKDATERQRRSLVWILGHELAHQWFGNFVTMPWWDDLWLNEAFATWMEPAAVLGVEPAWRFDAEWAAYVLDGMTLDRLESARKIRQPIERFGDINSAFDDITYAKGALVIGMFARYAGHERFQTALTRYFDRFAHGNATAMDFLDVLSESAAMDVRTPFSSFLDQDGLPLLGVEARCVDGRAQVRVEQSRYLPLGSRGDPNRLWQIPACFRFARLGHAQQEKCILLKEKSTELALDGPGCLEWLLPNAGGDGYYRFTLDEEAFRALVAQKERLTPRERLMTADAVASAFEAGRLPGALAFDLGAALADSDEKDTAEILLRLVRFARRTARDEEARRKVERWLVGRYRPILEGRVAKISDAGEKELFEGVLTKALALDGKDEALRRRLASEGRALLEDRAPRPVDPDAAAMVAVEASDESFFDRVLEKVYSTSDLAEKRRWNLAVASATRPELARKARRALEDPRIRGEDLMGALSAHFGEPQNAEAAWPWLVEHFDSVLARIPGDFAVSLIALTADFCSAQASAEVEAFFSRRLDTIPGGDRELRLARESIELCDALAKARRQELEAYFAK